MCAAPPPRRRGSAHPIERVERTKSNTGGDMTQSKCGTDTCNQRHRSIAQWRGLIAILFVALTVPAADADVSVPADIQALVDSPDRSQTDRETDKRRHPAELLAFCGVKPGMSVLDVGTGRGYTAELLTRAVGPMGSVVAQNDPIVF